VTAVQRAIEDSGETFEPSPGQIRSHVHHRVANITVDALFDFLCERLPSGDWWEEQW
jgi:hypothetical protein